tara:strand:+ start:2653 stop:3150 length:498 start_codon:yes stop_codon:yes gene_type:complete
VKKIALKDEKVKKISEEDKFGDEGDKAPKEDETETRESAGFEAACNNVITKTNEYFVKENVKKEENFKIITHLLENVFPKKEKLIQKQFEMEHTQFKKFVTERRKLVRDLLLKNSSMYVSCNIDADLENISGPVIIKNGSDLTVQVGAMWNNMLSGPIWTYKNAK